ncbi:MAG: nucleotidyltransferase [Acidobacteriota bacterium]|nr:nucleotidyltransferase [Acidobacteriota bacterium]
MELTDTQLNYFVNNRLKLPKGKRAEYLVQVDRLIERFAAAAEDDAVIGIKKFLKTGSLRKGTVLRPKGDVGVDADVAVFLTVSGGSEYDLANLHSRIRRLLVKIYPTKKPEDFTIQPRTLGIEFLESGLELDLVPLITIDGPGDYGWQPSSRGESPVKTSVTKQLEFIRTRKDAYANFAALVRLLKYWRNFQELGDSLRSFTIELILSHLQNTRGVPSSLEEGLLRFFLYVADSELKTPICFKECGTPQSFPEDRVVILDPCNVENNVARKITDQDCKEIVAKCLTAWETLTYARNYDGKMQTLELWKDVFGRSFVIED